MAKLFQLVGYRTVANHVPDAYHGAADQLGIDAVANDRLAVELCSQVVGNAAQRGGVERRGGRQLDVDAILLFVEQRVGL